MGNCSSTSNCNPCGPDFNAINQLATKAGAYARQANTYAVNAENSWLEFNALYLGAFAVAPTVDNEGNPLQVGALYWNSVSSELFIWDGSAWIPDAFNEFTPFLATGTTTQRNLVTRFSEVANVKDFGAIGDGVADDTAAIQAAINTSKQYIYIPQGNYRTTATINLSAVGKYIFGAGNQTTTISAEHTNGPVFQIKQRACRLENLFITAIGARLALATTNGNNHGVQVAGTNDSGTTTLTYIKSVLINNQPDCGMYIAKSALNTIIEQVSCQTNRSHGFLLDDGTYGGVSARDRLGMVNFNSCRSSSNGGNAMCIAPIGGTCYRIVADNLEVYGNCTNPLVSGLVTTGVLVRCQNATFINCAIESGAGPCFELRNGTTNFYCNNFRAISSDKILNCGSLNIDGIFFDNVYVAPALTSGIGFDLSTGTRGVFIRLANSDGMTTPVRADSRSGYFWIGNDQYRIYEGTLHYLENGSNAYTIVSGTVRVAATSIELTGEGNVADSVSYIAEPQAGGVPEDGTRFTLINPNAYNITINDGTVNIETRGGVNIVLAQNDAATFVMYGGIAYES